MALDEALLRSDGPPTLRLYGWSPPGLSLGWFQPLQPFLGVAGPHHIVRRRTGGGAIYHADEITFSLALDAVSLPADIASSYVLLHRAVQRALARIGVEVVLVDGAAAMGCGMHARPSHAWCFAVAGPHDLILAKNHKKIVGSAQRRLRQPHARVLHHGSIVLRAPAATPFCGAVADVIEPTGAAAALRQALTAEISVALGLRPQPAAAPESAELSAARAALPSFANAAESGRLQHPGQARGREART